MSYFFVTLCSVFLLPLSRNAVSTTLLDVTTIYDYRNVTTNVSTTNYTEFEFDSEKYITRSKTETVFSVKGRVIKRNNALGLGLFSNEELLKQKYEDWPLVCEPSSSCTGWQLNGWLTENFSSHVMIPVKNNKTYDVTNGFKIHFKEGCGETSQFFTLTSTNEKPQSFHVFKVVNAYGQCSWSYYYDCDMVDACRNYNYYISQPPETSKAFCCSQRYTSGNIGHNSLLYFDFESRVVIKNQFNQYLMNWGSSYSIKYLTGYWNILEDTNNKTKMYTSVQTLIPTKAESSIISPLFTPASKSLCLALILHSVQSSGSVLHISAEEDISHKQYLLFPLTDLEVGWQVRHVKVNLDVITPIRLIITNMYSHEIEIYRISTCSSYGAEVELLPDLKLKELSYNHRLHLPIYSANFNSNIIPVPNVLLESSSETCFNGGVMTSDGCACPPGFSGVNCKTGCGRNRLGQDCGSSCSFRSRECEGFLVCSPIIGCQCAPGYSGLDCTSKCSGEMYGNDCKQKCGHCSSFSEEIERSTNEAVCDIYTGKCKACKPGFVPPFCKQEYVHYSSEPNLESDDYGAIKVKLNLQTGTSGFGEAKIYQIQYKKKINETEEWKTHVSKVIQKFDIESSEIDDSIVEEIIENLQHGVNYQVRALLLDASYNKYDGSNVGVAEILTKCDIPDYYNYELQGSSTQTTISFSWRYELDNSHWCPLELFEVTWKENDLWNVDSTTNNVYNFTDLVPERSIEFKVRAKTSGGMAPSSKSVIISTEHYETGPVEGLRMLSSRGTALDIFWLPPFGHEDKNLTYKITYECESQLACPRTEGCVDSIKGQLAQPGTAVTLSALLPFSQYKVVVTPERGIPSQLYVGTTEVDPTETPQASIQRPVRSNSSVTVFWDSVPVCSSFLLGYNYHFYKAKEETKILASGFTKETSVTFNNLTASTDFEVKVFITTVAGWNPEKFLIINVSTSATVPEGVRNLTVYKRGRNMLGLRWAEPQVLYGKLKSFTVQHSTGKDFTQVSVEPTPCVVWPHLFCHTLENLRSNRKYTVLVSARNMEVNEDGVQTSVTAFTKEAAPSLCEGLKVVNRTSTSVGLQWRFPELANGVLRSFVINVEESERQDQDSCCQVYPLIEVPVKEESRTYEVEVSGLHPASTYYVSVSAKTVSMGPSQSLVVFTQPPHLPMSLPLELHIEDPDMENEQINWLPQDSRYQLNNSVIYTPLIRTRIVLVTWNSSHHVPPQVTNSGIKSEAVESVLRQNIQTPFCFYGEYDEEGDVDKSSSDWGEREKDCDIIHGMGFQLVAVQITDYNDVFNVDYQYSSPI